jgi:hypothetical protein
MALALLLGTLLAIAAEWRAFGDNARLMADPRRFARERA